MNSKEKKPVMTEEDIMKLLDSCYEKCLNGIPKVSPSVEELANDYLKKHRTTEEACRAMLKNQIAKCTTSGVVTGFGGFITMPVAIPANVGSVIYVQMRMIACVAYMADYRRIHCLLRKDGIIVSEKIVRRIMNEEQLIVKAARKRKYNSYKGEITPEVDNIIKRDFSAKKPNEKWLTDITEFHIPAGKIYLSPIIDCFDGMVVSWTIGTSPNSKLANTMLQKAIEQLDPSEHPLVHSDRGCHYRWPEWINLMDTAGLTRSMSKKGCSPDNSACEGFFGRLKNEMFYGRNWNHASIDSFIHKLDEYIHWYNETRIKISLGGMSPFQYRRSLGIAI